MKVRNTVTMLLLCTWCLIGCESGSHVGFEWPSQRLILPDTWTVEEGAALHHSFSSASGKAPLEVALTFGVQFGEQDQHRTLEQIISKMEIDYGEGAGWQDVTAAFYQWDWDYDDGVDLNHVARHTYAAPGMYMIRGRATYWDGEVVTLDESTPPEPPQPITVTVLAP
jgi:hypothetical protein